MSRLEIYDQIRQMHRRLKDIPDQEDNWDQNALDTLDGVLYLVEAIFVIEPNE